MKNYQIRELENIFYLLVQDVNEESNNNSLSKELKEKYIEYIYKKIGQFLISKKIRLSNTFFTAYVQVVYNNELYGEKIYRIHCPWNSQKSFYVPENVQSVECPLVNFVDVINYYKEENKKEQLKNILIALNELIEQGLNGEEIEIYIKNILYNENTKQKVKTP